MNSTKDFEEYEEVQEGQDGEEEEEEDIISVNNGSPGKNKQNLYNTSPNGHWLVYGKTGAGKITLVKKMILNVVLNNKNIFWFHSHPYNDYIEPF